MPDLVEDRYVRISLEEAAAAQGVRTPFHEVHSRPGSVCDVGKEAFGADPLGMAVEEPDVHATY
jgi:hypothetical protein